MWERVNHFPQAEALCVTSTAEFWKQCEKGRKCYNEQSLLCVAWLLLNYNIMLIFIEGFHYSKRVYKVFCCSYILCRKGLITTTLILCVKNLNSGTNWVDPKLKTHNSSTNWVDPKLKTHNSSTNWVHPKDKKHNNTWWNKIPVKFHDCITNMFCEYTRKQKRWEDKLKDGSSLLFGKLINSPHLSGYSNN